MNTPKIGGSFAPPLNEAQILAYRNLALGVTDARCRQYMLDLINMLTTFRQTAESTETGAPHPLGIATVVPLEQAEIERIWDVVPWPEECDLMGVAFDKLTGESRNAAYHLLWYARELAQDREPITQDKLTVA